MLVRDRVSYSPRKFLAIIIAEAQTFKHGAWPHGEDGAGVYQAAGQAQEESAEDFYINHLAAMYSMFFEDYTQKCEASILQRYRGPGRAA